MARSDTAHGLRWGALAHDVLAGDLVLKGYGDPKLTLEGFWLLLRNLRERGLKDLRGNLARF